MEKKQGLGKGAFWRYGFELTMKVYNRAKRKCEQCGEENDLTIHHKDRKGRNNFEKGIEQNNNIKNLTVLCRACHGSLHGKQNKEYWDKKGRMEKREKDRERNRKSYWKNREKVLEDARKRRNIKKILNK